MTSHTSQANELAARIKSAYQSQTRLKVVGGNSKLAYGEKIDGETLSTHEHRGIIAYEPSELFITALSGTLLSEVENTLRQQRQMLAFEPPHLGTTATVGGCVACGLSGPARMTNGSVRDAVLGVAIINGKGETLRFGGRMIKNVAGYDAARLMCGALGTLGLILEVTFRVVPIPEFTATLKISLTEYDAIRTVWEYIRNNKPVTATFYTDNYLYLRLSGYRQTIEPILAETTVEHVSNGETFWDDIKEQQHPFFTSANNLWRISLPANTPPLDLPGTQALEWNGALRWLNSDAETELIRSTAERAKGHACLFSTTQQNPTAVFHPLPSALMSLHKRIKHAFDPAGIINRGRLYPEI